MMTRAQVEELLAIGRARIAEWRARLNLTSVSDLAVVDGSQVTLNRRSVAEVEEAVDPWEQRVFGRITGTDAAGEPIDTGWVWALRVSKTTGELIANGFFWEQTQLISLETGARTFDMELQSRSVLDASTPFEEATYRTPVAVVVEEYIETNDVPGDVVDTTTFLLRRPGQSRNYGAPETLNEIHYLRATEVRRI